MNQKLMEVIDNQRRSRVGEAVADPFQPARRHALGLFVQNHVESPVEQGVTDGYHMGHSIVVHRGEVADALYLEKSALDPVG